jgi:hypothetical protein
MGAAVAGSGGRPRRAARRSGGVAGAEGSALCDGDGGRAKKSNG